MAMFQDVKRNLEDLFVLFRLLITGNEWGKNNCYQVQASMISKQNFNLLKYILKASFLWNLTSLLGLIGRIHVFLGILYMNYRNDSCSKRLSVAQLVERWTVACVVIHRSPVRFGPERSSFSYVESTGS